MKEFFMILGALLITIVAFAIPLLFGLSLVLDWYTAIKILLFITSVAEFTTIWCTLTVIAEDADR